MDPDELARLVPTVDPGVVEAVHDRLADPSPSKVAAALNDLARAGKVPAHDYRQIMADNAREQATATATAAPAEAGEDKDYIEIDGERVELEPPDLAEDDPLSETDFDPDPTSEANRRRGDRATAWARDTKIDDRAEELAVSGDIEGMVDLLNTVNRQANEALMSPEQSGLGGTKFKTAMAVLTEGIRETLDGYAERGDVQALHDAKAVFEGFHKPDLREAFKREAHGFERLATAIGTEFEQAKAWALDAGHSLHEMFKHVETARYHFDITYEQQKRLTELAKDWKQEYLELHPGYEPDDRSSDYRIDEELH